MNSKKKKGRKNVIIRCRKISSTSNRSQLSFHPATPAGKYRRQISNLLKNNKTLALALEDTRCDLASKKKLLDESSQYLNKMMFARFKMLEMYSGFKSFIKDFDEVLLLLEVDNSKWNDSAVPSRYLRNWKNKMKKVVETVEENTDSHSVSEEEEIIESAEVIDETFSNKNFNVGFTSGVDLASKEFTKVINEIREDCHDAVMRDAEAQVISMFDKVNKICDFNKISNEENNTIEMGNQCDSDYAETITSTEAPNTNHEMASQLTIVSPNEGVKGIRTGDKIISRWAIPLNEDAGSPKVSIPWKLNTNTEVFSNSESNFYNKNTLPSKKSTSELSASDVSSSLKIQSSKIPIKSKMKANSTHTFSEKGTTSNNKVVKQSTERSNSCKRKTFVIKDAKNLSELEIPVILDKTVSVQENFVDKNMGSSDDSGRLGCRRKTFVIKTSDMPKNTCSSPCDRRKTFVKRTGQSSEAVSIKNKGNTLTVSEHISTLSKLNSNCAAHSENFNAVEPVNIENNVNLGINDVTFEKETSCTPIKPTNLIKLVSLENSGLFQCNSENVNNNVNIHNKNQANSSILIDTSIYNEKNEQHKIEVSEKIHCKAGELQNNAIAGEILTGAICDFPNVIENSLEIENEDLDKEHSICGKISKPFSVNLFLDSSESDLSQSIPDIDLCSIQECLPIKTPPIRGRISKSKTKKVFVFDANKKEAIPSKISTDCVSEKSPNISSKQSTCQPYIDCVNNIQIKNQDAGYQKDMKKRVSFMNSSNQTNKTSEIDNDYSDLVSKNKELEKAVPPEKKNKSRKTYKRVVDAEDCITSVGTLSKDIEGKNLNDVSGAAKQNLDNSPVILKKNGALNKKKKSCCPNENENNSDPKCDTYGNKSKASSNAENKARNFKSKKSKRNSNVDDLIDNIISVPKKRKKNKSGKIVDKDAFETKSKKCVNKAENKVKQTLPLNKSDENTFLVHAEVHSIPPCLNTPENDILKEGMEGLQNFQVSVVLNDIFESENACKLNVYGKDQLLHKNRSFPLKNVLSDNVPMAIDSIHKDYKATGCATQNPEEVTSTRRRHKIINYKEPSLMGKMRQK